MTRHLDAEMISSLAVRMQNLGLALIMLDHRLLSEIAFLTDLLGGKAPIIERKRDLFFRDTIYIRVNFPASWSKPDEIDVFFKTLNELGYNYANRDNGEWLTLFQTVEKRRQICRQNSSSTGVEPKRSNWKELLLDILSNRFAQVFLGFLITVAIIEVAYR